MPNKYFKTVILVVAILVSEQVFAQPTPPGPTAPIDSGVIGLIIVAMGYAVKKIRDNSKF